MPANNPRTARVVLFVTRDTRTFLNVIHMARQDGATLNAADVLSMANVVADWWQNSYRHSCPSAIVGLQVIATKQDPSDPIQSTVYINGPRDQAAATPDPADVTGAVSFRTGLAGRKYRGRFFHFAPNAGQINLNDTFQGGLLSLFTAVGNYLLTNAATAALQVIIFHGATNTYNAVNQVIVDQLVDSMRNRLAGRGM